MPSSATRPGTRSLPPFGLGDSAGSNGPITSHNPSLTKASGSFRTSDPLKGLPPTATAPSQHHAGQYDRTACRLPRAQGLAEDRPGQRRSDRRLQEQSHRGEGGRQPGEGVGDEALAKHVGDDGHGDEHRPALPGGGQQALAREQGDGQERGAGGGGTVGHYGGGG